jgi:hypothetical protein
LRQPEGGSINFVIWTADGSGNCLSNTPIVSGGSTALEMAESTFHQDLNGDGVIGLCAAPGTTLQIAQALSGLAGAVTIGAGATLELAAADSATVTFAATAGTLIIDHAAGFTGQLINLTGTGNLASSDVIDFKDVAFASATQLPYNGTTSGGTLTVKNGNGHNAALALVGDYTIHTFVLSDDGHGGTRVIDPPAAGSVAAANAISTGPLPFLRHLRRPLSQDPGTRPRRGRAAKNLYPRTPGRLHQLPHRRQTTVRQIARQLPPTRR